MAISPITGKPCEQVDAFDVRQIIEGYKRDIGVDVSSYYKNKKELELFECKDTKLRFFHPAELSGDNLFYTSLEDRQGYYDEWKWDYAFALPFIDTGSKVLDIGCGRGAFLKKIKDEKNCTVKGLELNPSAYEFIRQRDIDVEMRTIEDFSADHQNEYDYVVFFQVLEHILEIKSFMSAALSCLKPGGKLILAVPNNEPYMFGFAKYDWLNLPPHHMGWWNKEALSNLTKYFPIRTVKVQAKPFREYNSYLSRELLNRQISNPGSVWWFKLLKPLKKQWIQLKRESIPGIFIAAVYEKL